jgi:hypothetical protein
LREVVATLTPANDTYGRQKVRLVCGHEVWASSKAIYRARCHYCRATQQAQADDGEVVAGPSAHHQGARGMNLPNDTTPAPATRDAGPTTDPIGAADLLSQWPTIHARRAYFESQPDGYQESDRDFLDNNGDAAVWLLEHANRIRALLGVAQATTLLSGPCGWVKTHRQGGAMTLSFTDKREHYVDWATSGELLTPVFAHAPGATAASWLTLAEGVPANGNEVWIHTSRGDVLAARKAWKQGPAGDYFATEGAGDIAMADVRHWMPRRTPPPPVPQLSDFVNGDVA